LRTSILLEYEGAIPSHLFPTNRLAKKLVKPRLATIRDIAMNGTAFGCFIEGRNKSANLFGIGRGGVANAFLKRAKPGPHTPVLIRASERLSGAFRCRFRIGHCLLPKIYGRGQSRGVKKCQDVDLVRDKKCSLPRSANQARGPDAIFA
jgi:hypothetical protein